MKNQILRMLLFLVLFSNSQPSFAMKGNNQGRPGHRLDQADAVISTMLLVLRTFYSNINDLFDNNNPFYYYYDNAQGNDNNSEIVYDPRDPQTWVPQGAITFNQTTGEPHLTWDDTVNDSEMAIDSADEYNQEGTLTLEDAVKEADSNFLPSEEPKRQALDSRALEEVMERSLVITEPEIDTVSDDAVMRGLFQELNHYIYANGIHLDPQKHHACLMAWFASLWAVGNQAAIPAGKAAGQNHRSKGEFKAGEAAERATWNATGVTIRLAAWHATLMVRRALTSVAKGSATWIEADAKVKEAAGNAVRNALESGAPPEEIGRAAKLAAFKVFLVHFKSIIEPFYLGVLDSLKRESSELNPMTSDKTFLQFCDSRFAELSPDDRNFLGLHIFLPHFNAPHLVRYSIVGQNSPLSILPRDVLGLISLCLYDLAVFPPLCNNNNLRRK